MVEYSSQCFYIIVDFAWCRNKKNIWLEISARFCNIEFDKMSPTSLNDNTDAVFTFNAFIFNKSPLNNKQFVQNIINSTYLNIVLLNYLVHNTR